MLDRDRWTSEALSEIAQKTYRRKRKNIIMAVSNPCFEFWLYLHVAEWQDNMPELSSQDMTKLLRQTLGSYNKTNIDIERFRGNILVATERARALDSSPADRWPQKTGSYVYRLIDELKQFCVLDS